jgi:hypothetical protein
MFISLHSLSDKRDHRPPDLTQYLPNGAANPGKIVVRASTPVTFYRSVTNGAKRGTTMNRKLPVIALLVGALAVTGQASAHGRGGWEGPAVFGAIVGSAIVGSALINRDRPVYVQQPVYVQPQPVYVQQPPPVYYVPQPVYIERPIYYRPAPVYYGPPRGYYYGPPRGHYGRW